MSAGKVEELKRMVSKRERIKENTYSLYSLKWRRNGNVFWTPPFLAPSDEMALNSLVELSRSHPELQNRYLYCVGSWCAVDCRFKNIVPRLIKNTNVK